MAKSNTDRLVASGVRAGLNTYEGYSSRGMFGATTTAVVVPRGHGWTPPRGMRVSSDSLGHDTVYYCR